MYVWVWNVCVCVCVCILEASFIIRRKWSWSSHSQLFIVSLSTSINRETHSHTHTFTHADTYTVFCIFAHFFCCFPSPLVIINYSMAYDVLNENERVYAYWIVGRWLVSFFSSVVVHFIVSDRRKVNKRNWVAKIVCNMSEWVSETEDRWMIDVEQEMEKMREK